PPLTADLIVEMQQKRDFLAGQLHQLFDDVDVLVLPTMPILPFEAGRNTPAGSEVDDWMSWNPFTPAFNLAQTPALSYPLWPQGASMPMGVQFVAARGRDDLVLALAEWLEQRRPVRLMSS
ncbi:amidase family protein, partial [Bordetella pseudohinzii]